MTPRPVVLSPATPTELLQHIISQCRYPTTLVIGCSKEDFLATVVHDIKEDVFQSSTQVVDDPTQPQGHVFLHPPPLFQLAISRHIRLVFTPTVTHFRAWMATFSPEDSRVPAPPNHKLDSGRTPQLIMYGLLELHRDASEWSAQGISHSAAIFVSSASRSAFQAVLVEPEGAGGNQDLDQMFQEQLPLLNGSSKKDDGSWSGRTVTVGRVLSRWFEMEPRDWKY